MRIRPHGDGVAVTDNPAPFWLFYAAFVLGGAVAVWLSLRGLAEPWQALLGTLIGVGNIAGGLYMMVREPASRVEIDPAAGRIRVVRWSLAGRRETVHALGDLVDVDVEVTEHSDGGNVYRPRLRFAGAHGVPVSAFWYQREAPCKVIAEALRRYCRGGNR